jgi:hypothetical protein
MAPPKLIPDACGARTRGAQIKTADWRRTLVGKHLPSRLNTNLHAHTFSRQSYITEVITSRPEGVTGSGRMN